MAASHIDLELKLAELKINGFCVLEQIVPVALIDACAAAFMPLLDAVRERDPGPDTKFSEEVGDPHVGMGKLQQTGGGPAETKVPSPHRYTLTVPWVKPFADRQLYENPTVLALLEQYWGSEAFHITNYHSNNPRPGSRQQHWHRDTGIARDMPWHSFATVPCVGVKFPFVDTNEKNGSIEVLPCTQYLADPDMETQYESLLLRGDFRTRRLNLKRGDCWIQDIRTLHRGTANTSDHTR
jgi:ectoine hydroxylase-related dioxygenase (phytanoyl-CoA dioxygenase family)